MPATALAGDRFSSLALDAVMTADTTGITPQTRQVQAQVRLTGGSHPIALEVRALSPRFRRVDSGRPIKEGPALALVRMRASNPLLDELYVGSGFDNDFACEPAFGLRSIEHGGSATTELNRGVILKARQSVTFELTYDVSPDAPWVGTDFRPIVQLSSPASGFGPSLPRGTKKLERRVTLRPPKIAVWGPFAARIDLDRIAFPTSGKPAAIRGTLVPARGGRLIKFRAIRYSPRSDRRTKPFEIGSAITDVGGRFSLSRWSPRQGYYYLISPSYPEQPGDLLADEMCPTALMPGRGS